MLNLWERRWSQQTMAKTSAGDAKWRSTDPIVFAHGPPAPDRIEIEDPSDPILWSTCETPFPATDRRGPLSVRGGDYECY